MLQGDYASVSADLLDADWSCNHDNIDSMYNTFLQNYNHSCARKIPLKQNGARSDIDKAVRNSREVKAAKYFE